MSKTTLKIGPQVLSTYKRLSYTPWYALAEFVDNSTQSYINNKEELDEIYKSENQKLRVEIVYDRGNSKLTIWDNSIGMSHSDLEHALHVGEVNASTKGRSRYGMGMKTASCWFGNTWTVRTKKVGEEKEYTCVIDVEKIIATNDDSIIITDIDKPTSEHYTEIVIERLHKVLAPRTMAKIAQYLARFYTKDIEVGLRLTFQGTPLTWDGYTEGFYKMPDGKAYRREFEFTVSTNSKEKKRRVEGWVMVLDPGSRNEAGFTVFMEGRVIQSPPLAYRPTSIFGQEAGTNDLINQRVVGELYFTGFDVSHTKDTIIWTGNEEEEVEDKLHNECKDAIEIARAYRPTKKGAISIVEEIVKASPLIKKEVESAYFFNAIEEVVPFRDLEETLEASIKKAIDSIKATSTPFVEMYIDILPDPLIIKLFFADKAEAEPYLFVDYTGEDNLIIGVINVQHPYYITLKQSDAVETFLRQCIYDAIAEWKCRKHYTALLPNVFRSYKDRFMRVPLLVKPS